MPSALVVYRIAAFLSHKSSLLPLSYQGVMELVEEEARFQWVREAFMGVEEQGARESSSSARAVAG